MAASASPIRTLGIPTWLWCVALGVVISVAVADLIVSTRRRGHEPGLTEAALCTAAVVALGALFGVAVAATAGGRASGQFFAGWLTEYSLSVDNLFVFILLIGRSAVPAQQRSRVLLLGIGLALVLRGAFIAAGAAALNRFDWVLYVFGGILLFTAGRLAYSATQHGPFGAVSPEPRSFARSLSGRGTQVSLLALVGAIAVTDLVFALDSIPAVFGLTHDPYLVFAANAFALLGLRHLYFLIGGLLNRLVHLSAGLAVILSFIGVKLLAEALTQSGVKQVGPVPVPHISTGLSLCVIGGVLAAVTVSSLLATRGGRLSQSPADRAARPGTSHGRPGTSHGRPSETRQ